MMKSDKAFAISAGPAGRHPDTAWIYGRRHFLTVVAGVALKAGAAIKAAEPVMRPAVSESACPLERVTPIAEDGHPGLAFLRKPPGNGPFPAAVVIHPGIVTWGEAILREYALNSPLACGFLAKGYVVAALTYRSRDHDPQDTVSLRDCLAVVSHVRRLPFVDPKSIVVCGCSGGGDLALEVAAATEISAVVPEEPASLILTGNFNTSLPKKGARYTSADAAFILEDPKRYYTPEFQKLTRAKLERIQCPILIIQGDVHHVNWFNRDVLIPELRTVGKKVEVLTYPGEPHCFCFYGEGQRTPRPEVAHQAFTDMESFCRRQVSTKPRALDSRLVTLVPVKVGR